MYLRHYRREDLEQIFALDCLCFAPPFRFSRTMMRGCAERAGADSILACQSGTDQLLGFVIVHVEPSAGGVTGYVDTLDVSPAARRQGIAASLMAFAEAAVFRRGAGSMELHVSTENGGAISLYERLGYQRLALVQHFYTRARHAWAYAKVLNRSPVPVPS